MVSFTPKVAQQQDNYSTGTFGTDVADFIGFGSARREREFNSAEALKQRQWEEQMSNKAYQRAVNDMKEAGLNPALMYSNGANAASTPSGSSAVSRASGNGAFLPNIISSASGLINSITNAKKADNNSANYLTYLDVSTKKIAQSAAALVRIAKYLH